MDKAAKAAFSFFLYVLPPAGCGKKRGPGGAAGAQRAHNAKGPGPAAPVPWRWFGGPGGARGPRAPKRRRPPGPRFFYGADDAILEESPGAAGDSVQGG